VALTDTTIPIAWRIAFMLLHDPVLDYRATADAVWGPVDMMTAKNRVSTHLAYLRRLGVITTLGSNGFKVDKAKLRELSGIPFET
jgi:hypothetical protein